MAFAFLQNAGRMKTVGDRTQLFTASIGSDEISVVVTESVDILAR